MKSKESEYKELFLIEAKDNQEQLDKLFVDLEKDHHNAQAIKEIFRITHTMKGNAMGMGFDAIADLSHLIEDVMLAIQQKRMELGSELFQLIFRANDKLSGLIGALETNEKVSYLGIKTSLSLFLEKNLKQEETDDSESEGDKEDVKDTGSKEQSNGFGSQISFSDVIQVPVRKLDEMMNEVGQLIIERDRLLALSQKEALSSSDLEALKRVSSNLQYSIMNVRMVQVGFLFNKFHRVLRDASSLENKKANLVLKGTEVEIDRNILKIIGDALVHVIRNAVSHGIESPEKRKERGKSESGTVELSATHERDRVIIAIEDDGGGIDTDAIRAKLVKANLVSKSVAETLSSDEVIEYIFESGFSNAETVNELSGRGVGMDVVKKAVESVGGQVKIKTEDQKGTRIELHVPASLALKGTLLFEVDQQEYAIALAYTEAVITLEKSQIHKLGAGLTADFQGEAISIIFMKDLLSMKHLSEVSVRGSLHKTYNSISENELHDVLVVSYGNHITGIVVDRVIQQKEVIEKPLARPLQDINLISGATILGNGKVCPVIDISVLTDLVHKQSLQRGQEETK
ncbi:chemotaxis protein CheA [Marinoscillum sp. MHG1-6]|uniref:chemotaxis protein CheA n=1 Tax=Marinoscillum sp. MHG1-6 TaxID=2959627 RepID=UPI00215813E8|nr:chemotaxis protein CheA [Marinoscillum sp. MHG1-6]